MGASIFMPAPEINKSFGSRLKNLPGFSGAPVFSPTGEVVGMVLATLANTTLALPLLFCQAVVNYALHNPSIGGAKIMGGPRFIPEDLKVESHLVARLSVKKD